MFVDRANGKLDASNEFVAMKMAKNRRMLSSATALLCTVLAFSWALSTWEVFGPHGMGARKTMNREEELWMETQGKRAVGELDDVLVVEGEAPSSDETVVPPTAEAAAFLGEGSGPMALEEFAHLSNQIPECSKDRKRPGSFLVFMTSHAGSTAIFSELTMHPDIFWDRGPNRMVQTYEPLHEDPLRTNLTAGLEWVRKYFTEVQAMGQIPAFKISVYPVLREMDEWMKIVEEFDTQIIFNYRRDHLRRAVGRYAFEYMGDRTSIGGINTHSPQGAEVLDDRCSQGIGCTYEVESMEDLHCIMTRSWRSYEYRAIGVEKLAKGCALHVAYEDYLDHPDDVIHQILDYLKLPRVELETLREKGTSNNLCEVVSNFGEVCAAFAECPMWGWALEDEESGCSCKNYNYVSKGGPGVNPLCDVVPPAGRDFWCYGVCQFCPQTPEIHSIFPNWPETTPFNDVIISNT